MNSLATLRQRQIPWARRVLGLFVVVWLNLVLQPCAMAMGAVEDHDCPHCPPSHARQHDGHDMSSEASRDMPCATSAADCSVFDEANVDGRTGQLKLKNAPTELPVAMVASAERYADVQPKRTIVVRPPDTHPPDSSRSLNTLYCVYLI